MKRWALVNYGSLNGGVYTVIEQETKPTVFLNPENPNEAEWIEITDTPFISSGWRFDKTLNKFVEIEPPPAILNKKQMIDELGNNYINIVAASKNDAVIEVWREKFNLVDSFDLGSDEVKNLIKILVDKKLLSKAESDRILSL